MTERKRRPAHAEDYIGDDDDNNDSRTARRKSPPRQRDSSPSPTSIERGGDGGGGGKFAALMNRRIVRVPPAASAAPAVVCMHPSITPHAWSRVKAHNNIEITQGKCNDCGQSFNQLLNVIEDWHTPATGVSRLESDAIAIARVSSIRDSLPPPMPILDVALALLGAKKEDLMPFIGGDKGNKALDGHIDRWAHIIDPASHGGVNMDPCILITMVCQCTDRHRDGEIKDAPKFELAPDLKTGHGIVSVSMQGHVLERVYKRLHDMICGTNKPYQPAAPTNPLSAMRHLNCAMVLPCEGCMRPCVSDPGKKGWSSFPINPDYPLP